MKPRRNVTGSQIRRLRRKLGWSQDHLAAELQIAGLNISRSTLAKIEGGSQIVADYQMCYFMHVFNASYLDLAPFGFNPHVRNFHRRISSYLCTEERKLRNL